MLFKSFIKEHTNEELARMLEMPSCASEEQFKRKLHKMYYDFRTDMCADRIELEELEYENIYEQEDYIQQFLEDLTEMKTRELKIEWYVYERQQLGGRSLGYFVTPFFKGSHYYCDEDTFEILIRTGYEDSWTIKEWFPQIQEAKKELGI